ncbi:MAG: hypothetical protein WCZ65_08770, partial [Lysobacteraceae bacterium]
SEFVSPQRRAATVAEALHEALRRSPLRVPAVRRAMPRQLRHFRVPVQVEFGLSRDGRSEMSLVCTDRPGLLAMVSAVLRGQRLRVHDARIATFGERVEDFFVLTDEGDHQLDAAAQSAVKTALLECLDPSPICNESHASPSPAH